MVIAPWGGLCAETGTCGQDRLGSQELRGGAKDDAWLLVPFETGPPGAGSYPFLSFGGFLLTLVKNQYQSPSFVFVIVCGVIVLSSHAAKVGLQPWRLPSR